MLYIQQPLNLYLNFHFEFCSLKYLVLFDNLVDGDTYTIELDHPNFSILKSSGGWLLFNEGGMLLVNVGQDIIRAFSNSCPHQGCRTSWKYSNNNFTCTCHNAVFTNIGERVSGPAPSDLTSYTVVRDNDIITVTT